MDGEYLFQSDRIGFRDWTIDDLPDFSAMSADEEVMRYLVKTLTPEESEEFIRRQKQQFEDRGYCYFAVDLLTDHSFLGFIGLSYQDYESPFNPSIDIGWRLKRSAWGQGLATEGAKLCLTFAFETLSMDRVVSVCLAGNMNSENVMKKLGMTKRGSFIHSKLKHIPEAGKCVWYDILNPNHEKS